MLSIAVAASSVMASISNSPLTEIRTSDLS
jgi:hypothetical protein